MSRSSNFALTQADDLDNIAPTPLQGQQAWQYAQNDNFLSPEEHTAIMQNQLEPYRAEIEAKLTEIGYPPHHLAKYPELEAGLYSGKKTGIMDVFIVPGIVLEGRFRIGMTENGPEIFFTPYQHQLSIPDEISGVKLSKAEKEQLAVEGALHRPILMADKGDYVPTYLRVDQFTNTVELWRVRPEMLPTKLMGIDLTRDQQLQLANGHAVRLSGLLDKQGEPFNATVSISATQKEIQFSDFSRLGVDLKPDSESRQQLALNNDGAKTDLTRSQELSTGQTITSDHQRETMRQLLEDEPELKLSRPRQRIS